MNERYVEQDIAARNTRNELENLTPDQINAHQWLSVSQRFLDSRIEQYKKYGNPEAESPEFMAPLKETISYLTEMVEQDDLGTVKFLSQLESSASNGRRVETPNYIVLHGDQLSQLALMVEEAQYRHDHEQ
jgi:hypothetical protein